MTTKCSERHISIDEEIAVSKAIFEAKVLAEEAGFEETQQFMVSTAVAELAMNIFSHALKGEVTLRTIERGSTKGIEVIAEDNGPGIQDIASAMMDHFTTGKGLGLGLPGAKRLMDEFIIHSEPGKGTKITARKWVSDMQDRTHMEQI